MAGDRPGSDNESTGSLYAILAEGFLSRLSFGIIGFTLPLFAYRKLGLSLTETGFLFSINLIAEQLFKPVMGWVADRVGVKRVFTTAIAFRSLVALLFAFSATPFQVFAIKFLHGFSESLRDPTVSVLIAENARKKSLAQAFGWYTTAKMSAGSVGKALGGILLAVFAENYSIVFFVAFVLSILPLLVVARYVREPPKADHQIDAKVDGKESIEPTADVKLLPVVILGFLIAGTAQMIASLFPLLAMEYAGLNVSQTSAIYGISVFAIVISGPVFGWISDNVSRRFVMTVRGIANTISSVLFFFFPGFAGMTIGLTVDSMGKAAFRPAWGAIMAQLAGQDRQRRARTMSYLSLGEGLGETLGPLIGGFIWNTWGVGAMLAVRVVMALIGEVYALSISRELKS
ncbi:MAG: MFS transporter [Acidobacteria bacterium]|nr:MFS transporter [Acidobacteriota bacterium]